MSFLGDNSHVGIPMIYGTPPVVDQSLPLNMPTFEDAFPALPLNMSTATYNEEFPALPLHMPSFDETFPMVNICFVFNINDSFTYQK